MIHCFVLLNNSHSREGQMHSALLEKHAHPTGVTHRQNSTFRRACGNLSGADKLPRRDTSHRTSPSVRPRTRCNNERLFPRALAHDCDSLLVRTCDVNLGKRILLLGRIGFSRQALERSRTASFVRGSRCGAQRPGIAVESDPAGTQARRAPAAPSRRGKGASA